MICRNDLGFRQKGLWFGAGDPVNPQLQPRPATAVSLFDLDISDSHNARQSALTEFSRFGVAILHDAGSEFVIREPNQRKTTPRSRAVLDTAPAPMLRLQKGSIMQTRLAEQERQTSRSLSEWLFRAGVFVWVILSLMAGWLNEVGLSMLTHFAGESDDPSAERAAEFGHFACAGRQPRRI